jgi:serine/threonine protein kinase
VRITDFGLARAIDDASLTQSGVITGTPQYMSPEQTRSEAVNHRSDLFSLGSTLYAMCAGHAPFRSNSPMAVLLRIREEQPRPIRAINPDVPVWLAGIIEKLHAKAADRRFQSAAEVADVLGRCLAHVQQPETNPLPPAVAGWTSGNIAPKFGRKAIAAVVLLVLALCGAAAVRWTLFDDAVTGSSAQANSQADTNREQPVVVSQNVGDALAIPMADLRRQTERIEAELYQPVPPNSSNDVGDALLRQAHQRLDKLERELAPPRPRQQ